MNDDPKNPSTPKEHLQAQGERLIAKYSKLDPAQAALIKQVMIAKGMEPPDTAENTDPKLDTAASAAQDQDDQVVDIVGAGQ